MDLRPTETSISSRSGQLLGTESLDRITVLNLYHISVADRGTWQVDETGYSCVLWLNFPSDDPEQKSENEVKHDPQ